MTEKCAKCKRVPPEGMLSPLFLDGVGSPPICPVCALEMGNKHLGIYRSEFQGETAQYYLEETKKHYEETNQK